MPGLQRIARTGQFRSTVTELTMLSPRMRRIVLSAPELAAQDWPLGCDIAIVLSGPDSREVRRRYTVRHAEADRLTVDAVLHGHGPGSSWAAALETGREVTFFGPRGEVPVPEVDWLLALTDEAGLPAVAAVAEATAAQAAVAEGAAARGEAAQPTRAQASSLTVFAEIADDAEHYPLPPNVQVHWLPRGSHPAGTADLLAAAITDFDRPPGRGYAYVLGESRAIVALRDGLAALELDRSEIYAKGYWNLNARPTR
jgi:NADPH-dependent ferric siderophore reductase